MTWLEKYYGIDFKTLNPEVVVEGKQWAVVKLNRITKQKGFSSVGYVLIKKRGSHASSPYVSLHEGIASQADLNEMTQSLKRKEEE